MNFQKYISAFDEKFPSEFRNVINGGYNFFVNYPSPDQVKSFLLSALEEVREETIEEAKQLLNKKKGMVVRVEILDSLKLKS